MSNDNSSGAAKILLAFFGGMAAGVAAGLYLNSEHGRKMRHDAADKLSDLEEQIEEKVKEAFEAAKEKAEEFTKSIKK
jgi:gas vesicle protein